MGCDTIEGIEIPSVRTVGVLEEIQESADEEPIMNSNTQQEVVTSVKPDDISLPIRIISGRVSKPPQFYYGFHIEEGKISFGLVEIHPVYKGRWDDSRIFKKETELNKSSILDNACIFVFMDYEIWKMDVKIAFLNRKLTEDVFMAQTEGFENAKYPKRVCKLQKAIYGLKQASRS
ncbi:retrotransposon protein, putative, ty1-copia subclass [Tanacetum coccineum]